MITKNLVVWQFRAYPSAHASRLNLLLHALTAPLFVAGALTAPAGLALGRASVAVAGLGAVLAAAAMQARGHRLEANPPAPFRSPLDAVARLVVEQFVTFPRFVLSGRFAEAWRLAR